MNCNTIADFISLHRERLDLIMDLLPIPVFIKNRAGLYIDCNKAFNDFLSISREDIIGKSVYDLWSREEADLFFSQDEALFTLGGVQIYETKITSANGVTHTVQFHKQIFNDSYGNMAGFLGVIFDITEKKKLESTLEKLAVIDELTGLANRRDGMTQLEHLHEKSQREMRPYCIAMIDLDNFKRVNDQFGHLNGDLVLRQFADLIQTKMRDSDICFRYGGEEFIIILPDTKLHIGFEVIEQLRKAWAEQCIILSECQSMKSTISIGLVQNVISGSSCKQLLQMSDKALYLAKNGGRNCTVSIQADM